jgi:nucleotide-binding universal stress UspA family protein
MKLDRIIAGVDFSKASERGASHALAIARRTGAEVVLIHICDVVELDPDDPDLRQWGESRFRDRRAALQDAGERLSGQGAVISHAVHDGDPAGALCEVGAELGAGLIAVGSHGAGGAIERFLIGSVAAKVLRLSDRPVLIARGEPRPGGFHKILVAVDLSELSERVVETALALAADRATVELFHCWDLPAGLVKDWGGGETELISELRQSRARKADDRLEQLLLRHRDPRVELHFEHAEAPARDGVLRRLEGDGYDLVVLGSHGRRGIERLLLGSVAEGVARAAPCSVVVVKP